MNRAVRLPQSNCPVCASKLDAATGMVADVKPREDDYSVCKYCGAILRFNFDMSLRLCPPSRLEDDPQLLPEDRMRLLERQALIRAMRAVAKPTVRRES